jgi:uncharacterized protein DUF4129
MFAGPALLLSLAFAPFAVDSPQGEAAKPRLQAKKILDDGHYQQTPPPSLSDGSNGEGDEGDAALRDARRRSPFHFRGGSTGFIEAPLLVPIVVGALLLLLLLLGVTRRGGAVGLRHPEPLVDAPRVAAAAALPAVGDPDLLAGEGRFAEAIHALLLRALRGLARSIGGLARGLTSREILPRAPAGAPRAALEELVGTVERHEFAAQPLSAADYQRCRAAAAALPMTDGAPAKRPS